MVPSGRPARQQLPPLPPLPPLPCSPGRRRWPRGGSACLPRQRERHGGREQGSEGLRAVRAWAGWSPGRGAQGAAPTPPAAGGAAGDETKRNVTHRNRSHDLCLGLIASVDPLHFLICGPGARSALGPGPCPPGGPAGRYTADRAPAGEAVHVLAQVGLAAVPSLPSCSTLCCC